MKSDSEREGSEAERGRRRRSRRKNKNRSSVRLCSARTTRSFVFQSHFPNRILVVLLFFYYLLSVCLTDNLFRISEANERANEVFVNSKGQVPFHRLSGAVLTRHSDCDSTCASTNASHFFLLIISAYFFFLLGRFDLLCAKFFCDSVVVTACVFCSGFLIDTHWGDCGNKKRICRPTRGEGIVGG